MAAHYDLFLSYARGDDEPFVKQFYTDYIGIHRGIGGQIRRGALCFHSLQAA